MPEIITVSKNKKNYLDLLLLADPYENMINKYLDSGKMYVLKKHGKTVSEAVVTRLSDTECELKNLATYENEQKKGYAGKLIKYIVTLYKKNYRYIFVGTSKSMILFYEKHGFHYSHTVKNFFTDNYPQPIFENGEKLADMIYLKRELI